MDFLLRALAILLAVYGAAVALLYFGQRSLMYFPASSRPDRQAAGLAKMSEVLLKTADGLDLLAWHRPPEPGRPTVVYLHGNAGSIQHRGFKIQPFLARGFGVLAVEYRGYGGNPGRPSEEGLLQDGQAALRFLEGQAVASGQTVLYGESLGSGVATALAHGLAALGRPAGGLILEAPFTSIADVAASQFPIFPVRWLVKDRFDNRALIAAAGCPLLILHGERDMVIPASHGRDLHAAASEPKRLAVLPQAGHEDIHDAGGLREVWEFLAKIRKGSS